ncbi:MAG: hypothetical protein WAQ75_12415, partial [Propionicimonas sp.]
LPTTAGAILTARDSLPEPPASGADCARKLPETGKKAIPRTVARQFRDTDAHSPRQVGAHRMTR